MDGTYPLSVYEELEPLCDRGHVLLVRNRIDGQLYVKKQIHTHAPELYRLLQSHPVDGMPRIHAVQTGDEPGTSGSTQLVVIEELSPGRTRAQILEEEGPFREEEVIDIGIALCGILQELHSRKPAIIHRDIKPVNVIRQPDGTITLLDLSAAKPQSFTSVRDTVLLGTAGYAAPEQYGFSASTTRTDLYGMGVLLNVLRTGALPWERRAEGRLRPIISRCLKLEPKARYLDARELYAALKQASRTRIAWLPPGFRCLKWYRMIPAAGYYGLFLLLLGKFWLDAEMGVSFVEHFFTVYVLLGLGPVAFYGNYLDIQRFFPFLRSPSRGMRLLGLALFPLWVLLLLMTLLLLEEFWRVLS